MLFRVQAIGIFFFLFEGVFNIIGEASSKAEATAAKDEISQYKNFHLFTV